MTERTLKRLAIALGVAVVLWGVLALTKRLGGDRPQSLTMPRIDSAKVDTVSIARRADTIILTRDSARWRVNGKPANTTYVGDLLRGLVDTTARSELIAESQGSHARLGVDADSGRHVRVVSGAKTLADAIVGRRTSDWSGVFVRRANEDAVYTLHQSDLAGAFTRELDEWRNKRIATVPKDSVTRIELRRGARSYALTRSGQQWMLGGAAADSSAVAELLREYEAFDASGFATTAQTDSADFRRPAMALRLLGKTPLFGYVIDSSARGVWARADTGGEVFRLDPWRLSRLAPPESTLRAKAKK